MQAIQTHYKKCHFRSRLEARWAVFFDSLQLSWEYEKEGFKLKNGSCYLPDFWLPTLDCFFEVKGQTPTDEERHRAALLSDESQKLVVIASGTMSVEQLNVGEDNFGEWPVDGFNLEAFGGRSDSMWSARAFGFQMWSWMLSADLLPFIQETFPNEFLPTQDSAERRQKLVELDQQYYKSKYDKEHPRYRWGRYEKRVCWAVDGQSLPFFAMEPIDLEGRLSAAYEFARSARFEVR